MNCPKCNEEQTRVIESRVWKAGRVTVRRRHCDRCNWRWSTDERSRKGGKYCVPIAREPASYGTPGKGTLPS